ncbi:MAG: DUF2066 domain-containing protein [Alphaproteobacteria bacterium]|nr:DUF2066 domain-containing protein [Alphaproteobacteria bacterium]
MKHPIRGVSPSLVILVGLALVLGMGSVSRPAAAAAAAEPYTVTDVPVDVTSDTAAAARDIAIRDAQSTALGLLMRRMTLKEDWSRLPQLDAMRVSSLVNSIEFNDERYSTTRYIAKITIAFNPRGIASLLRGYNIPFAQAPDEPTLVLPVYERNGATQLWNDSNPWWDAWDKQDWSGSLITFELPNRAEGGPDAAAIAADQGAWRDEMSQRYGTTELAVPVASWDTSGSSLRLTVDLRIYGVAGNRTETLTFDQQPGETPEALLARAARDVGTGLTNDWKKVAMLREGPQSTIKAVLDMQSLRDLITVEERLKRAPVVKSAMVESLNVDRALFNITVSAPPEQLAGLLQPYGLDLASQDGDWRIAPRR